MPKNKARRFVVGLLPTKLRNIERQVSTFRRVLEDAVTTTRGEMTLNDQANVTTATRYERLSQCCSNWLRTEYAEMSHADRLAYAKEAARASAERDKCIKALKLDSGGDWQDELYARPVLMLEATATTPDSVQPSEGERSDEPEKSTPQ